EAAAKKLEGQGSEILERGERTLAGRPALSLRSRVQAAGGPRYEVEIHYLVVAPRVYAVQCNWAAGTERPAAFDALLASFALFDAKEPEVWAEDAALAALADRWGSQIAWCADWKAAAAQAREQGRLVFVAFENFPVLNLPHTLASGALTDPDLVALVQ